MLSDTKQFAGWPIGEAIRRCADPDLLSRWFADHRNWQQAKGSQAAAHTEEARATKALWDCSQRSYAGLQQSLLEDLLAGRLVAWGKRESANDNQRYLKF